MEHGSEGVEDRWKTDKRRFGKREISLADESLEEKVLDLALASKNNTKISDKAIAKKTRPYTVYLKK